eukprot:545657-Prymnesium_polylepis.2
MGVWVRKGGSVVDVDEVERIDALVPLDLASLGRTLGLVEQPLDDVGLVLQPQPALVPEVVAEQRQALGAKPGVVCKWNRLEAKNRRTPGWRPASALDIDHLRLGIDGLLDPAIDDSRGYRQHPVGAVLLVLVAPRHEVGATPVAVDAGHRPVVGVPRRREGALELPLLLRRGDDAHLVGAQRPVDWPLPPTASRALLRLWRRDRRAAPLLGPWLADWVR